MSSERAVEAYYTVADLVVRLRVCDRTVRRKLAAGEFSPGGDLSNVLDLGDGDLRIPASGVNYFIGRHPYRAPAGPVKARSIGELRRKARGFSGVQTLGQGVGNG